MLVEYSAGDQALLCTEAEKKSLGNWELLTGLGKPCCALLPNKSPHSPDHYSYRSYCQYRVEFSRWQPSTSTVEFQILSFSEVTPMTFHQATPSRGAASHSGWHQNGDIPGSTASRKQPLVTKWTSRPLPARTNHIDVARGSAVAAWQEPNHSRPAVPVSKTTEVVGLEHQSRQLSAYRRWLNRNKIGQKRGGGLEDDASSKVPLFHSRSTVKYRETLGASVILYLGLGMIAVGLVITLVGLGDANFHTLGLKLIGPVLAVLGVLLCGIRILVCACASKCSLCDRPVTGNQHHRSTIRLRSRRQDTATTATARDRKSTMGGRRGSDRLMRPPTPIRRPPTPARLVLQGGQDGGQNVMETVSLSRSSSFQDSIPTDPADDPDGPNLSSDDSYSLSEFQEIELQNAPVEDRRGLRGDTISSVVQLGDGVLLDANALNNKTTTNK